MDGRVQGAHEFGAACPRVSPWEKISRPRSTSSGQALAGLRQVGGRSQDFVLRTASWAKFSRPSGAIAKQLRDGHRKHNRGYLPKETCPPFYEARTCSLFAVPAGHSSRNNIIGSTESARLAGIQV